MFTSDSVLAVMYVLGAVQGFFLALALFTSKSSRHKANIYLGGLTLVFVCALVDYFADLTGLTESHIAIRTFLWPKEFLYGTLIYFYARELTHPNHFPLSGRQWLHFLPSILHVFVTWPLLLFDAETQAIALSQGDSEHLWLSLWGLLLGDVELYLAIIQLTTYLILSIQLIRTHQERVNQNFSFQENVNLLWLRNLLIGIFLVYFIWLAEELIYLEEGNSLLDALLGLSMVALIYCMGFMGLRQPIIFSATKNGSTSESDAKYVETTTLKVPEKAPTTDDQQEKYQKSSLSVEMCEALMAQIDDWMEKDKSYLNSQLSLPQLAEVIGVSVNYISQAINEQAQRNFFDYVNSYRVKEVSAKLKSDEKQNILELGLASGFNSKSAFYTAFRKHTGMTPGQYRKANKIE